MKAQADICDPQRAYWIRLKYNEDIGRVLT